MNPPVFIVILQYNNSQDTIECLDSIFKIQNSNFKTIVVDNASDPEHVENIKNWINSQGENSKFQIQNSKSNLGYSGGNNLGIKIALENGADYILILNNDTAVGPDLLDKLVKTAQSDPQIGVVSPLINEGNKITYGGRVKWLSPELEHIYTSSLKFKVSSFYVPGVCMLVKKEVFEKIGMFNEKYFLYFEDADFSLRAKKAGFKLAIAPDTAIKHKVSASTKKLGSPLLLRYHMRNSLLFNRLHSSFFYKILIPFWSCWIILKQLTKIMLRLNPEHSKAIFRGVTDFYTQRWGMVKNK